MSAAEAHLGYHRRDRPRRLPMSSPSDPTAPAPTFGPNAAEPDPLLGRVIAGNFRIEKLLGAGAMGNVYKAEQLSLGKAVAVKVLHAHLMSDEKLVLRFKREAKSASLLNHPNSIQIIDSGQDRDGTLYIAMELLSGRDLAHVIRDDFPLSLPRIVRIMSQVLSALDEAHAQGVIHRDLKPSNIMLIERRGERDFVKVCDFGIAKAAINEKDDRENMLTIQGLVCGTPEYMAPEQARGEVLDGRADLYAAAVILFQMVTGDIPFKGDTPMAIVSRHLVEAPALPSRRRSDVPIPPALDALILRGMEKNRELRFPNGDGVPRGARGDRAARYGPLLVDSEPARADADHAHLRPDRHRRGAELGPRQSFRRHHADAAPVATSARGAGFRAGARGRGGAAAARAEHGAVRTAAPGETTTALIATPHRRRPATLRPPPRLRTRRPSNAKAAPAVAVAAAGSAAAPAAAEPSAPAHEPELAPHAEEPAPPKAASAVADRPRARRHRRKPRRRNTRPPNTPTATNRAHRQRPRQPRRPARCRACRDRRRARRRPPPTSEPRRRSGARARC